MKPIEQASAAEYILYKAQDMNEYLATGDKQGAQKYYEAHLENVFDFLRNMRIDVYLVPDRNTGLYKGLELEKDYFDMTELPLIKHGRTRPNYTEHIPISKRQPQET